MATTLSPGEEAQLAQTIEMFEVITQSQPSDYQSLEILKEAYSKLGRESDVVFTSKRIAEAYVQMGQLSSAILEYETILQRCPEDPDVQKALQEIEARAASFPAAAQTDTVLKRSGDTTSLSKKTSEKPVPAEIEDGRRAMYKIFVDGKVITAADFELCWPVPNLTTPPTDVIEPFIGMLADKGLLPVEKSLKLLSDKSRFGYLPLGLYDIDIDLARAFPSETCRRWCVLPFDRISKSILVATANPFNQQAIKELAEATNNRLLYYIVPPVELVKNLKKAFR